MGAHINMMLVTGASKYGKEKGNIYVPMGAMGLNGSVYCTDHCRLTNLLSIGDRLQLFYQWDDRLRDRGGIGPLGVCRQEGHQLVALALKAVQDERRPVVRREVGAEVHRGDPTVVDCGIGWYVNADVIHYDVCKITTPPRIKIPVFRTGQALNPKASFDFLMYKKNLD